MALEQLLIKIDEAAVMWNKTKDPYYKTLWYRLLKKFESSRASKSANGISLYVSSDRKVATWSLAGC